jgi:hypothetical protein
MNVENLPQFNSSLFNDSELEKLFKQYFNGDQKEIVPEQLYRATFEKLSSSINEGYSGSYDIQDVKMVLELKSNVAVFSAFKSHSQASSYVDALTDESGKKRTWSEFKKAAEEIDRSYNSTWLESEYNMAVRQANAAKQWQGFLNDRDVYPNLEYMPSLSANPSTVHMRYYGLIKPIDDPIWNTLMPPSRWGCKCWVQQTREDASDEEVEAPEPLPGIEGNPGKSGRVFSSTSPFILDKTKEQKTAIKKALYELKDSETETVKMKAGKNFVNVHIHADPNDLEDNIRFIAPFSKKYKEDYQVRSHSGTGRKPELQQGKAIGDLTTWDKAKSVDSYIQTNWKQKYQKQLQDHDEVFIGFDFNNKLTKKNMPEMWKALNGKIQTSSRVKFVLLKNGEKVLKLQKKGLTYENGFAKINKELL